MQGGDQHSMKDLFNDWAAVARAGEASSHHH